MLKPSVEIPIARAAAPPPTLRGFLLWRLSDDGPRCRSIGS
jgi:hypothetical protein